jgi:hypothetical protein
MAYIFLDLPYVPMNQVGEADPYPLVSMIMLAREEIYKNPEPNISSAASSTSTQGRNIFRLRETKEKALQF